MTNGRDNRSDDAPLVARALAGDPDAFGELYDEWCDRVLDLAYRIVGDAGAAADVVRDTFLSARRNLGRLEHPDAFGGWLLGIARNAAVDRRRNDPRARSLVTAPPPVDDSAPRPEDTIAVQDDTERVAADASYAALLWAAADALGERDRAVLDLSVRYDLAPAEIADIVGMDTQTADDLVPRVRLRLATAIGARILWRDGTPLCAALRAQYVVEDIDTFDADAVRITDQHANSCIECSERRRTRLAPDKMFAALPIMTLPALTAGVANALTAAGVPMTGSGAGAGGSGGGGLPFPVAVGDGDGRGPRRRVLVKLLVTTAAIVLVGLAVIVINAVASSQEPDKRVAVGTGTTTSTTHKATTTTRSTSTTTSSTTTTTTVPVVVPVTVPPTTPPTVPPTSTTTIPVTVTFTLAPNDAATPYIMGLGGVTLPPVLTWAVTGLAKVHVYDNAKVFDSTKPSSQVIVCPNPGDTTQCNAPAGTYTYTLDAYDSNNVLVLHRTLTLTLTGP